MADPSEKPKNPEGEKKAPVEATVTHGQLDELSKDLSPALIERTRAITGRSTAWHRAAAVDDLDSLLDKSSERQIDERRKNVDKLFAQSVVTNTTFSTKLTYVQLIEDGNDLRTQQIRRRRKELANLTKSGDAVVDLAERDKIVQEIDDRETEIIQRRLFLAGLHSYLELADLYRILKKQNDPALAFDAGLEAEAMKHLSHLYAHIDQRVRLAVEYDRLLNEQEELKGQGKEVPEKLLNEIKQIREKIQKCSAYIDDLMKCDGSTKVPGANDFGMLPFHALVKRALEDENAKIVQEYKQLRDAVRLSDKNDEYKKQEAQFSEKLAELQKRSRNVCLTTEHLLQVTGRINTLRSRSQGALILRQARGSGVPGNPLKVEATAAVDRLNVSLAVMSETADRIKNGTEKDFLDDIARRTAQLDKGVTTDGPEDVYEMLMNKGEEAKVKAQQQWAKIMGPRPPDSQWSGRRDRLIDAMGWPRHPNGAPKTFEQMSPEERKAVQEKRMNYIDAVNEFNAPVAPGNTPPTMLLDWSLKLQKELMNKQGWDPAELAKEYEGTEPPDTSKLDPTDRKYDAASLLQKYNGDKRLALLHAYVQLHGDWNVCVERCGKLQQRVHDILGIHYAISAGEEYARRMQRKIEGVFDASEHVLYFVGIVIARAELRRIPVTQMMQSFRAGRIITKIPGPLQLAKMGLRGTTDLVRMARYGREAMRAGQAARLAKDATKAELRAAKLLAATQPAKAGSPTLRFLGNTARVGSRAATVAGIAGEFIDPVFDGVEWANANTRHKEDKEGMFKKFEDAGASVNRETGRIVFEESKCGVKLELDGEKISEFMQTNKSLAARNFATDAVIGAAAIACLAAGPPGWLAAVIIGVSIAGKIGLSRLHRSQLRDKRWQFFNSMTGPNHWILELLFAAAHDAKGELRTELVALLAINKDDGQEDFDALFESMEDKEVRNQPETRRSLIRLEMSAMLGKEDPMLLLEMYGLGLNFKQYEAFAHDSEKVFFRALERLSGLGDSEEGKSLNRGNRNQWRAQIRRAAYITVMHIREMRYRGLGYYNPGYKQLEKAKQATGTQMLFGRRLSEYDAMFEADKTGKTFVQKMLEAGRTHFSSADLPPLMKDTPGVDIYYDGAMNVDSWMKRDDPMLLSGKLRAQASKMPADSDHRKAIEAYCSVLEIRETLRLQQVEVPQAQPPRTSDVVRDAISQIRDPAKRKEFAEKEKALFARHADLEKKRGDEIALMEKGRRDAYVAVDNILETAVKFPPESASFLHHLPKCDLALEDAKTRFKQTYEVNGPRYLDPLYALADDCFLLNEDLKEYFRVSKRCADIVNVEKPLVSDVVNRKKEPVVARNGMKAGLPNVPPKATLAMSPNIDPVREQDIIAELTTQIPNMDVDKIDGKDRVVDAVIIRKVQHAGADHYLMSVQFSDHTVADRKEKPGSYTVYEAEVECGLISDADGLHMGNPVPADRDNSWTRIYAWNLSDAAKTESQLITEDAMNIVEKGRTYRRADDFFPLLFPGVKPQVPLYASGELSMLDEQDKEVAGILGVWPEPKDGWRRHGAYLEMTEDSEGNRHVTVMQLEGRTKPNVKPPQAEWRTRVRAVRCGRDGELRTGEDAVMDGFGPLANRDALQASLGEAASLQVCTQVCLDRQNVPQSAWSPNLELATFAYGGSKKVSVLNAYSAGNIRLDDPKDAEAVKALTAAGPEGQLRVWVARTIVGDEVSYVAVFETPYEYVSIGAVHPMAGGSLRVGFPTAERKYPEGQFNNPPKLEKIEKPGDIWAPEVTNRPQDLVPPDQLHARTTANIDLARTLRRSTDRSVGSYFETYLSKLEREGIFTVSPSEKSGKNAYRKVAYDRDGVKITFEITCQGADMDADQAVEALRKSAKGDMPQKLAIRPVVGQWDKKNPEGFWKFLAKCPPEFIVALRDPGGNFRTLQTEMIEMIGGLCSEWVRDDQAKATLPIFDVRTCTFSKPGREKMKKMLGAEGTDDVISRLERMLGLYTFMQTARLGATTTADTMTFRQAFGEGDLSDVLDTVENDGDNLVKLRAMRVQHILGRMGKTWEQLDYQKQRNVLMYATYDAMLINRPIVMKREFDVLQTSMFRAERYEPTSDNTRFMQKAYMEMQQNPWGSPDDAQAIIDGTVSVEKDSYSKLLHRFDPAGELAALMAAGTSAGKKGDYVYEYDYDKAADAEVVWKRRVNALKAIVQLRANPARPLAAPSEMPSVADIPDLTLRAKLDTLTERRTALMGNVDRKLDPADLDALEKIYADTSEPYGRIVRREVPQRGTYNGKFFVQQLDTPTSNEKALYGKDTQGKYLAVEEKQIADILKRTGDPNKDHTAALVKWEQDLADVRKQMAEYRLPTLTAEKLHFNEFPPVWRPANRLADSVFTSHQASVVLAGDIDVERDLPVLQQADKKLEEFAKNLGTLEKGPRKQGEVYEGNVRHITVSRIVLPDGTESFFVTGVLSRFQKPDQYVGFEIRRTTTPAKEGVPGTQDMSVGKPLLLPRRHWEGASKEADKIRMDDGRGAGINKEATFRVTKNLLSPGQKLMFYQPEQTTKQYLDKEPTLPQKLFGKNTKVQVLLSDNISETGDADILEALKQWPPAKEGFTPRYLVIRKVVLPNGERYAMATYLASGTAVESGALTGPSTRSATEWSVVEKAGEWRRINDNGTDKSYSTVTDFTPATLADADSVTGIREYLRKGDVQQSLNNRVVERLPDRIDRIVNNHDQVQKAVDNLYLSHIQFLSTSTLNDTDLKALRSAFYYPGKHVGKLGGSCVLVQKADVDGKTYYHLTMFRQDYQTGKWRTTEVVTDGVECSEPTNSFIDRLEPENRLRTMMQVQEILGRGATPENPLIIRDLRNLSGIAGTRGSYNGATLILPHTTLPTGKWHLQLPPNAFIECALESYETRTYKKTMTPGESLTVDASGYCAFDPAKVSRISVWEPGADRKKPPTCIIDLSSSYMQEKGYDKRSLPEQLGKPERLGSQQTPVVMSIKDKPPRTTEVTVPERLEKDRVYVSIPPCAYLQWNFAGGPKQKGNLAGGPLYYWEGTSDLTLEVWTKEQNLEKDPPHVLHIRHTRPAGNTDR